MLKFVDEVPIENKRVLLRVDFDVPFDENRVITNDVRIQENLPTIKYLLERHNKIICVAKLGRPKGRDAKFSFDIVAKRLQELLPETTVKLIDDFLTADFSNQTENEIYLLENIRFYPEENANDAEFAKKLASLADVYVNDAFAVCHREEASVVGVPTHLPSYAGLSLKNEIQSIEKAVKNPQSPVVAIMGGAKISTKIPVISKLIEITDHILIGGGLANTFFAAQGIPIGTSLFEQKSIEEAKKLLQSEKGPQMILPVDIVLGTAEDVNNSAVVKVSDLVPDETRAIMDIGPETLEEWKKIISTAKTIIWNGPVGYIENEAYARGSDAVYHAIAANEQAVSLIGGGDTLAHVSTKPNLDHITHVSTGGGAMLEFIEKGTLPGIDALINSKH